MLGAVALAAIFVLAGSPAPHAQAPGGTPRTVCRPPGSACGAILLLLQDTRRSRIRKASRNRGTSTRTSGRGPSSDTTRPMGTRRYRCTMPADGNIPSGHGAAAATFRLIESTPGKFYRTSGTYEETGLHPIRFGIPRPLNLKSVVYQGDSARAGKARPSSSRARATTTRPGSSRIAGRTPSRSGSSSATGSSVTAAISSCACSWTTTGRSRTR